MRRRSPFSSALCVKSLFASGRVRKVFSHLGGWWKLLSIHWKPCQFQKVLPKVKKIRYPFFCEHFLSIFKLRQIFEMDLRSHKIGYQTVHWLLHKARIIFWWWTRPANERSLDISICDAQASDDMALKIDLRVSANEEKIETNRRDCRICDKVVPNPISFVVMPHVRYICQDHGL